ncbi:MAG: alpha/beta hydrolase family esterase [Gammaproteobacteria bacterium]
MSPVVGICRRIAILCIAILLVGCDEKEANTLCLLITYCAEDNPLTSGLHTIESSGRERAFYIEVPSDHATSVTAKPVIFAYHGTGGGYEFWLDGTYDLADAVGDGAILVYMQATADQNGVNQWDFSIDLQYFEDVLGRLRRGIEFDPKRIFVTGHSSGGGMAHDLGCNYGDIVRGIAPHAGILKSFQCTGSVAVLQTHSENDTLVPWGSGETGHQFWVAYNGYQLDVSGPGVHPNCVDHSQGGSPYPMQWCLHNEGMGIGAHDWPSFASAATWEFFSNLPDVEPTPDPPPGGGNVTSQPDTLMSFTLEFPQGIGEITEGALSIYPAGTQQPVGGGPDSIINRSFDPGNVGPGSVQSYEVPIKYVTETFPGTYAFSVVIYVADGGNPIPFPDRDMIVFRDVDVVDRNTPVIIDTPLLMELVF